MTTMSAIAYQSTMYRGAVFSECRTWRYTLTRIWDRTLPLVHWCALNPSVANETHNDRTITREIGFTQAWGFGGLVKTNIFAYCSTYPSALWCTRDPIGPENDRYLVEVAQDPRIGLHVVAWGAEPKAVDRAHAVLALFKGIPVMCLGRTQSGAPKHPLFLSGQTCYGAYL